MLRTQIFELCLGRESSSKLAMQVGDGARYRMLLLRLLGMFSREALVNEGLTSVSA